MVPPTVPADLEDVVRLALAEDIGGGDITAQLIPASRAGRGRILSRGEGVLCGVPWAEAAFRQLDPGIAVEWELAEGDPLAPGQTVARVAGPLRPMLSAERTALNFLQTLSGTAGAARRCARRISHTRATLLDTRKTLPGLRTAQKYAVRVGGGHNHRMGLFDAFLIKENHAAACGGIAAAVRSARGLHPDRPVEVEVRDLEELSQAIEAGADTVLLDNFTPDGIRRAVRSARGRVRLEASGGLDPDNLAPVAAAGVDRVSVGALTKHCRAVDMSFLLD